MTILKGYGSSDWPISFAEALGYARLQAGDTIFMDAGTYTGNFTAGKAGAVDGMITIKPRHYGDQVVIDGNLLITGGYVRIEDLIINDTAYSDRSSSAGGHVSIDANASNLEIINCHVRNGVQGLSSSDSVENVFIYGCIFRLCGWLDTRGHGLYPQNRYAYKTIEHCLIGDNFGYGLHAWGSGGYTNFWKVLENISYQNGYIRPAPDSISLPNYQVGGQSPNEGHIIRGNISYNGEMRVGYGTGNDVTNTEVRENVLVFNPPLRLYDGFSASNLVENNRFYGTVDWGASGLTSANFPDNDYLALGTMPDENFLFANRYDSNRAHLAVFNIQEQADSIQVDVSNIYEDGDVINCHNVQDYFVDIQALTVDGGMITVNMQAGNRTVESAVGGYPAIKTFPQFGAFVLRRSLP